MDLNKAIKNRRSIRKFKTKKPDWRDIIECIDAARYAPMAGNIFSLQFILVDDKGIIQQLADAANQSFIAQVSYVVVVCSDSKKTVSSYEERGKRYLRQQAGAAIQNFLLKIEEKGLATCWIGAFADDLVKEAVKIPETVDVEAIFPIGYAFEKIKQKPKIDLDNILFFNKYKEKRMTPLKRLEG